MEVGNEIVIQNGTQWSFGNGVAQHFDEHVRQSIPLYDEGHDLVCHLSDFLFVTIPYVMSWALQRVI